MSKRSKIWLVVAVCFMLTGVIFFTGVMSMLKWDFKKLDTTKYENNTHVVSEQFKNISINTITADVLFIKSDDDTCKVECLEHQKVKHTVTVKDQTLNISINDNRKWYDHITFFGLTEPQIKVYLPKEQYGSLVININTGDIEIPKEFTFDGIDIKGTTSDVNSKATAVNFLNVKLSTGNVEIGDIDVRNTPYIEPENVNISVSTGKVELWRTGAKENLTVKTTTGDVWFYIVKAPHVTVKTTTGNVEGNLYTAPRFITKTTTGDVKVPEAKTDDVFEITTGTGDIYFKVVK